jgi:hypothetical protein
VPDQKKQYIDISKKATRAIGVIREEKINITGNI